MITEGQLAATIREALRIREAMRATGASEADVASAFEQSVRAAWPKPQGRSEPWHYLCERCNDTGLAMFMCKPGQRCNGISTRTDSPREKPGKYRRLCTRDPHGVYEHTYGEPCVCPAGERFKANPSNEASFTDAGKVKRQPTRFGR